MGGNPGGQYGGAQAELDVVVGPMGVGEGEDEGSLRLACGPFTRDAMLFGVVAGCLDVPASAPTPSTPTAVTTTAARSVSRASARSSPSAAPSREAAFALLRWFRRLRGCWEIRADIHQALLTLGCAIICWRRLKE
ncbi:hypothetical protein [Streptomyces sp. NPDC087538]|uniref:hypothetical protein n=1 Tax=Streptomyces sp. NPDC087538 TaxID=3365797 RepID=UPI0037FB9FF5